MRKNINTIISILITLPHFTAYYELQYFCTEIYESDPSYPNGGFWFLGYVVSNNYYSGRIGS